MTDEQKYLREAYLIQLRDRFACQALVALAIAQAESMRVFDTDAQRAEAAYKLADAMLEARER